MSMEEGGQTATGSRVWERIGCMSDQRQLGRDSPSNLPAGRSNVETFVTTNLAAFNGLARALCPNRETAEDLVAETIAAVVARWQGITTAPLAYTRRTMINLFLNNVRHRKVIQEIAVDQVPESTDTRVDPADGAVARIDLGLALAKLTPELRAVLVLRFFVDLPVSEVALLLHRPAGTIRRLTHEAITLLRNDGLLEGVRSAKR